MPCLFVVAQGFKLPNSPTEHGHVSQATSSFLRFPAVQVSVAGDHLKQVRMFCSRQGPTHQIIVAKCTSPT